MSKLITRDVTAGNGVAVGDQLSWGDVLFRFAMDGKVVRGQDGWLFLDHDSNGFLHQFAGELRLSERQLEQWRELLETRLARIGELGADYHMMIAPESPAVYPEKLPDTVRMADERTVQQVMRHLSTTGSPASLIYPVEDLLAEKSRRQVYRKTDSHWNDFGALVAYRRLMRELGSNAPIHEVTDEELDFYQADIPGDLSYKLGIDPGLTWCARYLYSRAHKLYDNCVDLSGSLVITECADAPPTKCVLFGDSSCWGMLAYLSQTFGRLVFAHSATIDYDLIAEEKPDVVVTVMVERYMIAVPDDSKARPVRELEVEKEAKDRLRPRVQIWDPLPAASADTRAPSIETVETARAHLLARGRQEDATFMSLMAYAGLSPAEALRVSWSQLENGALAVEPAYAVKSPEKGELRQRSLQLLEPLADDLAAWRTASGSPLRGYVFPGLRKRNWQTWIRMDYLPAVKKAGRPNLSPAALGDAFGALLIHNGFSPSEVGDQMGLERADVVARYWYLMDETSATAKSAGPSEQIREARAASETRTRSSLLRVDALSRAVHGLLVPADDRVAWEDSLGVRPLAVETVEKIRARLLSGGHHEEATFVSVMAYAGLRQGEALPLKWRQIKGGALEVEGSIVPSGSEAARKLRERFIPLLEPLAEDLTQWHAACGSPDRGWVFPELRKRNWQEWVQDEYRRAAKPAGRGRTRPHLLRHTFCALLIDEGTGLDELSRQMALSRHEALAQYSHLFEKASVEGRAPISASARIRDARAAVGAARRFGLGRMLKRMRRLPIATPASASSQPKPAVPEES